MPRATLVDISRYQLNVDMQALKDAGFDGAIIRCTIGWAYLDPFYISNFRRAVAVDDFIVMSYHVLWPWNRDPLREIDWAVENMVVDGVLPDGVVGDYELPNTVEGWQSVSQKSVHDQIAVHLPALQSQSGRVATAYSSTWWWGSPSHMSIVPVGVENKFGYHEAEYFKGLPAGQHYDPSDAPMVGSPNSIAFGWDDWAFWQWTSRGRPIGAPGASNMDYNVFNGTVDDLRRYLKLDPESPPPPPQPSDDHEERLLDLEAQGEDHELRLAGLERWADSYDGRDTP